MISKINDIHRKYLDARRMQNIAESDKFRDAYNRSSEDDKKRLDTIINAVDPESLNNWIKSIRSSYDDMTKTDLRYLAMQKRVKYYSRKSKEELITILTEMDG